ncbi:hypothetical protein GOP47_0016375 [Adiantum capillus-veneris]|uniref:Uncharacterized protein n=1 Tax=Adiantum capillus-veneris TaxID=13818 RepID=A0A9D4UHK1_ADICA|nr:hypothetical protein GOP47_0016375 [Adiantum capillus-veneris]
MPRGGKYSAGFNDYEEYDDGYDDYYDDYEDDHATSAGVPRAVSTEVATEMDNLWRCAVCTFDNVEHSASCDVCGVLRHPISTSCECYAKGTSKQGFARPSALAKCLFSPLPRVKLKKLSFEKAKTSLPGSNLHQRLPSFQDSKKKAPLVPFKFDTPSPDDLVLAGKRTPIKSSMAKAPVQAPALKKSPEVGVSTSKTKVNQERKVLEKSSKKVQNGLDASGIHRAEAEVIERLKEVDIKAESDERKPKREPGPPLDSYEPEGWMLETLKQENKQLLHLAIVGHVDAGKSTLMGRLLHILGQVSKKEMHKYEKEAKQIGKGSFSYAWVLDESAEERSRGITMTVAVAQFETPKYQIVVLDSPGHRDFIPNMISGASQADAAVVVVDASTGAFEAGMEGEGQGVGQTKEHTQLVRSFGVEQIVVAVNKMDAVGYSEDRLSAIKATLRPFLRQCGFKDSAIRWIPLSAMENENLVTQPTNEQLKSWYNGPSLLEAIDTFEPPLRNVAKPFRLPIAETLKSRTLGQAAVSGKIEGGAIKIGSKVLVMPSGLPAIVKGIEQNGKPSSLARVGDNADIGLQAVDPACLFQGGVLCHPDYPLPPASLLEVKVLVLETSGPLLRGSQVIVHCHHAKEPARITKLVSLLDQKGEAIPNRKPRVLLANQRAIIEIQPERGICAEQYARYKALGRIILRDSGKTLAVGIVTRVLDYEQ